MFEWRKYITNLKEKIGEKNSKIKLKKLSTKKNIKIKLDTKFGQKTQILN